MKTQIISLLALFVLCFDAAAATAQCSRANLTRCLDSACAINVSSNPSARCQYCGTSEAGIPPSTRNGMRNVSAGSSAKYNISDKELKKAPTDPGERYAWATALCITKVSGCTPDDVSEAYDKLIEQSCKAAGISAKMDNTLKQTNKKKTKSACSSAIKACVIAEKSCTANFRNCSEDADFDRVFSACGVESTGCDEYIASIRSELISDRDKATEATKTVLANIIAAYKSERETRITEIRKGCDTKSTKENCIDLVRRGCNSKGKNSKGEDCAKKEEGYVNELSIAETLCAFYDTACATVD